METDMKKTNSKFEAEYFVFAGKWRPLIMLLLLAVVCMINFFLAGALWQFAVITAPIMCMAIICFMDYFVFSGFNSRKSIGMDLIKSSYRGKKLVEAALKQDIVNKSLYVLAGSVFALVLVFMFNPEIEDSLFVIFYTISSYASSLVLMHLTLLLDRAKGLTMQTHMLICYLFYALGTVIILPLIFISETLSLPTMITYAVIAVICAVVTGYLLVRSCIKTYDASFHDGSNY